MKAIKIAFAILIFIAINVGLLIRHYSEANPFAILTKVKDTLFQVLPSNKDLNIEIKELEYIVDGFEIYDKHEVFGVTKYVYRYDEGKVYLISFHSEDGAHYIDYEDSEYKVIRKDGVKYIYLDKDGSRFLTWSDESVDVSISGEIEYEELMKIAKSINGK